MRKSRWGLLALLVLLVAGLFYGSAMAEPAATFPAIIPLPDGFQPEGIVIGRGPVIYAGSLATGDIYRADLRTGEGEVFIEGEPGQSAVGLGFDARTNYLYVSGGAAGEGRVYNARTGELLAVYPFSGEYSFINDVEVTRRGAFFTNSFQPELYRIPLGWRGRLPEPDAVETIPLGEPADFTPVEPPDFIVNSNGIEATHNGRYLIVVNSLEQALYRVDPTTGEAAQIDVGSPLPNGDGLVLRGRKLYVVQNSLNQIALIRLSRDYLSGEIVDTLTDPALDVPTTADLFGRRLYVVNARFGTPPTPTTQYDIVQVPR